MSRLHPADPDDLHYYRAICDAIARYIGDGGDFSLQSSAESGVHRITFSLDHQRSGSYFARLGAGADEGSRGEDSSDVHPELLDDSRWTFDTPTGPVYLRCDREGMPWASIGEIARLFGCSRREVATQIRILFTREFTEATASRAVSLIRIVRGREVARIITVHNLDVILAVGARVNPLQADALRRWAERAADDQAAFVTPIAGTS